MDDHHDSTLRRKAASALDQVQQRPPIDLIVELVEARYAERLRATIRWWISTALAIAALGAGVGVALADRQGTSETELKGAVRSVSSSRSDAVDGVISEARQDGGTIDIGDDDVAVIRFRGSRVVGNSLEIHARGIDDFDPVIDLYQAASGNSPANLLDSNDDEGAFSLNSRLEVSNIDATLTYELRVREFYGRAGEVAVSFDSLTVSGSES